MITQEMLDDQREKLQREVCKFLVGLDDEVIDGVFEAIEERFHILKCNL